MEFNDNVYRHIGPDSISSANKIDSDLDSGAKSSNVSGVILDHLVASTAFDAECDNITEDVFDR